MPITKICPHCSKNTAVRPPLYKCENCNYPLKDSLRQSIHEAKQDNMKVDPPHPPFVKEEEIEVEFHDEGIVAPVPPPVERPKPPVVEYKAAPEKIPEPEKPVESVKKPRTIEEVINFISKPNKDAVSPPPSAETPPVVTPPVEKPPVEKVASKISSSTNTTSAVPITFEIHTNFVAKKEGRVQAGWVITHMRDKQAVAYEVYDGVNIFGRGLMI